MSKTLIFALLLATSAFAWNHHLNITEVTTGFKVVTYIDRLTSYWGKDLGLALDVPGWNKPNPYKVINLAFLVGWGSADAANVWQHPTGYMDKDNNPWGTTDDDIRAAWVKAYHDAGYVIMVSAFGATYNPTSSDPTGECTKLANFVVQYNLDGIDLDYEDNDAMKRGEAEQWLISCTKAIRQVLPQGQYILTHAPQAPYFSGFHGYKNGGYVTVHQEVGDLIDWYNVQFYNQATTRYDSYEEMWVNATGEWNQTAVAQIIEREIPKEKIVIGKPVTQQDASNTGWISADDLGNWSKQGKSDYGWNAGFFTWQYSSDQDGTFMSRVLELFGASEQVEEQVELK